MGGWYKESKKVVRRCAVMMEIGDWHFFQRAPEKLLQLLHTSNVLLLAQYIHTRE